MVNLTVKDSDLFVFFFAIFVSRDVPAQVQALVARMKSDSVSSEIFLFLSFFLFKSIVMTFPAVEFQTLIKFHCFTENQF